MGHSVLTVQESGRGNVGFADPDVFEYARTNGLSILTFNRKHYLRLHDERPDHAGIVACKQPDPPDDYPDMATRIDEEVRRHEPLDGQVLRINAATARLAGRDSRGSVTPSSAARWRSR